MLLNNFYKIIKHESVANTVFALITFDKSHKIFEGHFPGHPVVPGVCMMQTVREIMEQTVSKKLKIVTGDNMKFLSIINPEETTAVEVKIQFNQVDKNFGVTASLHAGEITFFKFKGSLQEA
jgi:3-hydroxyacyl-[acyl-carrier-protein] dehydratase